MQLTSILFSNHTEQRSKYTFKASATWDTTFNHERLQLRLPHAQCPLFTLSQCCNEIVMIVNNWVEFAIVCDRTNFKSQFFSYCQLAIHETRLTSYLLQYLAAWRRPQHTPYTKWNTRVYAIIFSTFRIEIISFLCCGLLSVDRLKRRMLTRCRT